MRALEARRLATRSAVALKRLAGRPRDRQDLEALEEEHGTLPMLALPDVAESEEGPGPDRIR